MSINRALVWNAVFLLCSVAIATVMGGLLLLAGVSPYRSVGEAALIVTFFSCYTAPLTLYWYYDTYRSSQTKVMS